MVLRNLHTGKICTEKELVISWAMDRTYDYLNGALDDEDDDYDDYDDDEEPAEPPAENFADWLKQQVEAGEYEVVEEE